VSPLARRWIEWNGPFKTPEVVFFTAYIIMAQIIEFSLLNPGGRFSIILVGATFFAAEILWFRHLLRIVWPRRSRE
jgi:hypothetical protein